MAEEGCGSATTALLTRHIYNGLAVIEEHVWCSSVVGGGAWALAREFLWGDRFPEPLVLIDHTDLGDKLAADPTGPEVLHYVRDALGSVVGLVGAGDPEAQTPVLPALVEGLVGDQLLEPGVLTLQLLEPFGVVGLHAAGLVPPAVEGCLRHAELLADGRDWLAGGQLGVGLAELVNDLLGTVTFPFHRESPPPAAATSRPDHGLS